MGAHKFSRFANSSPRYTKFSKSDIAGILIMENVESSCKSLQNYETLARLLKAVCGGLVQYISGLSSSKEKVEATHDS